MFENKKIEGNSINIEGDNNDIGNKNISILIDNSTINNISFEKKEQLSMNIGLSVKQEYIDFIDRIEFISSLKDLTLNNTFIWFDFYFIGGTDGVVEENIEGSLNAFLNKDNKVCFIKGIDLSGKTSIGRKIFLESLEKSYFPLILDGQDIDTNTNLENLLKKAFQSQYNGEFEEFRGQKQKILIIDNYQHRVNKSFVSRCKEDFIKVMFLISEDEYILYFQDDKNYADFDIYTIKPFNNSKQQDLINSWLNNDIYDKKFDEIENKIDDITKNRIVSKFPFYLLTIIQSFDNYKIDLSLTSYGHCYYVLIIVHLYKKGIINSQEVSSCINYLKFLAFEIFSKDSNSLSISVNEYNKFKAIYQNKYSIETSVLNKLEDNNKYGIINKNGRIKFQFEYIYYYFVGKYIAEDEKNGSLIEKLCESIYKKSSANILIFTIHHSKDSTLLEEIQLHCMTIFDKYPITKLTKNETDFMIDIMIQLPTTILNQKSVSENRKIDGKLKDNTEEISKDFNDNEIERDNELMEFNKSFRVIEVLGQVLKNRIGDLEKIKIEELLLELENLGLRLISFLLNTLKSENTREFIEERIDIIQKNREHNNRSFSQEEKRKIIESNIQLMGINIVYGILFKIFQSVNIGQLLEFQKSITRKNKFPAYELLYLLFSINYHSVEISEIKNIYEKFKGEKNIWVLRTMSFFIQMYMNNHDINYKIRQQLVELLGLDKKFISNSIRNN